MRNDAKQLWWKQQECEIINETCICDYTHTICENEIVFLIWGTCAKLIIVVSEIELKNNVTLVYKKKTCNLNWQWLLIKVYVSGWNVEMDCDRWCVYRNFVCLCCGRWRNPKPICGNIFQSSVTLWTLILIMQIMWLKSCV